MPVVLLSCPWGTALENIGHRGDTHSRKREVQSGDAIENRIADTCIQLTIHDEKEVPETGSDTSFGFIMG